MFDNIRAGVTEN